MGHDQISAPPTKCTKPLPGLNEDIFPQKLKNVPSLYVMTLQKAAQCREGELG